MPSLDLPMGGKQLVGLQILDGDCESPKQQSHALGQASVGNVHHPAPDNQWHQDRKYVAAIGTPALLERNVYATACA